MVLVWNDLALKELQDIWDYISRDSVRYADITYNKIWNSVQILKRNPRIGRVVRELETENIREIIVFPYRII